MDDYIFRIVSVSGWSMHIYINVFFPCSQRNLLKVLKLIKESTGSHSKYIVKMNELYHLVCWYHNILATENKYIKLYKNEALIRKIITEALSAESEVNNEN